MVTCRAVSCEQAGCTIWAQLWNPENFFALISLLSLQCCITRHESAVSNFGGLCMWLYKNDTCSGSYFQRIMFEDLPVVFRFELTGLGWSRYTTAFCCPQTISFIHVLDLCCILVVRLHHVYTKSYTTLIQLISKYYPNDTIFTQTCKNYSNSFKFKSNQIHRNHVYSSNYMHSTSISNLSSRQPVYVYTASLSINMAPTATVHYNNMPYSRLHSKLNMLRTIINV